MKRMNHTGSASCIAIVLLGLAGCLETPTTSSWATDVFRQRLSSLKPTMTTAEVVETMGVQGGMRATGKGTTYDLTDGYTLTLFFDGDRDHPRGVVLHTPYENIPTHWTTLEPADLSIGAPATRSAH